jgi:hypothetical protein
VTEDQLRELTTRPTRATLDQLRAVTERAIVALPGADPVRPWRDQWQLQTSNSHRRIGTPMGDGDVLCATKQRDGHPDLHAPREILEYIVTMQPTTLLALLNRLDALERLVGDAP